MTKDFLTSFCCGGGFGGNDFHKIPIGAGGVLPEVDGLDICGWTFGGCGNFVGTTIGFVCIIFGVVVLVI